MTAADNDKRADESRPLTKSRWLYRRNWVQIAALLVMNSYFFAWAKGFCVPSLNCWACPGAIFGCPLGAIQNSSISARWTIGAKPWYAIVPFYVIGVLVIFSAIFGRMMCGWICPFGWLQDKLAALRRRHWRIPKPLRYLRYVLLVVLVTPWFCKLCPQGALQGGWLQPIFNPETRALIGTWWWIKQAILVAFILLMIFVKRPFCGAICPLGAIFSLFQRYSLWRIDFDADKCVNCMWCVNECPAGIDPRTEVNNHDCIGCLECTKCPYGAIQSRPIWAPPPAQKQVTEA